VYVKVTVPAETPVTTPVVGTTVALPLLAVQVPPVLGVKLGDIVAPIHTEVPEVTVGKLLIVTEEVVLLQPVDVKV
jgi:hypothetical protein